LLDFDLTFLIAPTRKGTVQNMISTSWIICRRRYKRKPDAQHDHTNKSRKKRLAAAPKSDDVRT